MSRIEEIQNKIFLECRGILESLSEIATMEDLLAKQDLFYQVTERVSFLKLLEENNASLVQELHLEDIENEGISFIFNKEDIEAVNAENKPENEEVILTEELNDIPVEETINSDDEEVSIENLEIEEVIKVEHSDFEVVEEVEEEQEKEISIEETLSAKEVEEEIIENEEVKLVEEVVEESQTETIQEEPENLEFVEPQSVDFTFSNVSEKIAENEERQEEGFENQQNTSEKKIKLANIRGLKPQSLFDEETLHQLEIPKEEPKVEMPKPRAEFRLDLNDRMAFTKMLFDGSQLELSETIRTLNTFETLDEAKEYLSDMYYDRGWDKVDEYAQRLWILVESKFL